MAHVFRSRSLWLAIFVLLVACSAMLVVLFRALHPAQRWEEYLARLEPMRVGEPGRLSLEYLTLRARLRNDYQRKRHWTLEDARALIALASRAAIDAPAVTDDMDQTLFESKLIASDVITATCDRMRFGAPISPEAKRLLADFLFERSFANDPSVRHSLTNGLCASGLIFEDKRIHDRVVEMIRDPDPEVAMNARRHYTWHTSTPEAQERLRRLGATPWKPEGARGGDDDG